MRTNYIVIMFSAAAVVVALLTDTLAPSCATIIAVGMTLALLACVSIVTLIFTFRWRKESTRWMRPLLLCTMMWLLIIGSARTGMWGALGNWWFNRNIAAYNSIVESFKAGVLPCNQRILTNLPPHMKNAYVNCCDDGGFWIAFVDASSSAVGHLGYAYKDCAENSECAAKFTKEWRASHISGNWYRISD